MIQGEYADGRVAWVAAYQERRDCLLADLVFRALTAFPNWQTPFEDGERLRVFRDGRLVAVLKPAEDGLWRFEDIWDETVVIDRNQ
ncbi:hypothetical protein TPY_2758 [Sulfobacillus acidophilus TPY]|nr:hypothetical protein TPY_2758 [Sulfobacillus acidophilus TPY]